MMSPAFLVLALSLLLGLQPLTTDLYLPALPTITHFFGGSVSQAQLTLSGLLLAFGASQLFWGPMSDRFGRKPVLLVGLTLYVLTALACTLASSMESLILWRCLQGVAMGAVVMCARALVRDLFQDPVMGARVMSQGQSGLGIIACIGTPIGGLLVMLFGWRAVMLVLVLSSAFLLGLILLKMKETLQNPRPDSLRPSVLLHTWGQILGHKTFWGFALLQTGTYTGLFVFLASSSFVFIDMLHLSAGLYGLLMFSMSGSYIIGTLICRRLLLRFSITRTVAIGGALSLTGGTLLGLLALAGVQSVPLLMFPVYFFLLGHGINQPCAQSGVMEPFPRAAGAASAWSGFVMVLIAFSLGLLLGRAMDDTALPMALGMWGCGIFIALVAWLLVPAAARARQREKAAV